MNIFKVFLTTFLFYGSLSASELVEVHYSNGEAPCVAKVDPNKIKPETMENGIKFALRMVGYNPFPMPITHSMAGGSAKYLTSSREEIVQYFGREKKKIENYSLPTSEQWDRIRKFEIDQLELNQFMQLGKLDYFLTGKSDHLKNDFLQHSLPDECKRYAEILKVDEQIEKMANSLGLDKRACEFIQDKKSSACLLSKKASILDFGWGNCVNGAFRGKGHDPKIWSEALIEIRKFLVEEKCEEIEDPCPPRPNFKNFSVLNQLYSCLSKCVPGSDFAAKHDLFTKSKLEPEQKSCVDTCHKPLASDDYKKEILVKQDLPLLCDQNEKEAVEIKYGKATEKNLICETKFTNFILTLNEGKKVNLNSNKKRVYTHDDFFFVNNSELILFGVYERSEFWPYPVYTPSGDALIAALAVHRQSGKQINLGTSVILSPNSKRIITFHLEKMDIYEIDNTDIKLSTSIPLEKLSNTTSAFFWDGDDKIRRHQVSDKYPETCLIFKDKKWVDCTI